MADYTVARLDDIEGAYGGGFKALREPLQATAFGLAVIQMPPNYADYPDHDHSDDGQEEIYVPLDGSGTMEIEGEQIAMEPGVFVRVAAGTKRKVLAGPDGIRFLCVGTPEGSYGS